MTCSGGSQPTAPQIIVSTPHAPLQTRLKRRLVVQGRPLHRVARKEQRRSHCQTEATASTSSTTSNWTADANIDTAINKLDSALSTLRSTASTLGSNASLISIRLDFVDLLVTQLEQGAGKLTNADLNEESANLLALQTRQQLGVIGLSIAQQSEQAVFRLF